MYAATWLCSNLRSNTIICYKMEDWKFRINRKLRFCTEIWQSCRWIMINYIVLILQFTLNCEHPLYTIEGDRKRCVTRLYTGTGHLQSFNQLHGVFRKKFRQIARLTCFCRQPEDRRVHSLPRISGIRKPCVKCFSRNALLSVYTRKSEFNYKPEYFLNPFSVHTKRRRFIKTW